MKGNMFLKRLAAYLLDFLIITLISSALVRISFINPRYKEYTETSQKYNNALNDYYKEKININEYTKIVNELNYDLNSTGYVYLIGDIVIAFLYFGVFAYFTKGQTLGKKLMNIKIVSNKENNDLKIYNYFIRTFILNGIIINIITFIAVWFSKKTYYKIAGVAGDLNMILEIIILLMILFNKDGRGLHDVLAGTKVIDLKQVSVPEINEKNDPKPEVIKPKKGRKKNE